jgi:hypothetical protein
LHVSQAVTLPPLAAGSSSLALRLTDFGAAFSLTETDTAAVGCEVQTLPYRAPEVWRGVWGGVDGGALTNLVCALLVLVGWRLCWVGGRDGRNAQPEQQQH